MSNVRRLIGAGAILAATALLSTTAPATDATAAWYTQVHYTGPRVELILRVMPYTTAGTSCTFSILKGTTSGSGSNAAKCKGKAPTHIYLLKNRALNGDQGTCRSYDRMIAKPWSWLATVEDVWDTYCV